MMERSSGAVVFRKEGGVKYLLLLYGAGHWDYVKGHIEGEENEEQTMLREAHEEAGLDDLKIKPGFREVVHYYFTVRGKKVYKEVVFLLAETHREEIILSHEHSDFRWLSYEDAVKLLTFKGSKDILRKANNFLEKLSGQSTLA